MLYSFNSSKTFDPLQKTAFEIRIPNQSLLAATVKKLYNTLTYSFAIFISFRFVSKITVSMVSY